MSGGAKLMLDQLGGGGTDMACVLVTGSSTGLGLMAAQLLIELGHLIVAHGRNQERADAALGAAPGAEAVVVGDLSRIREMRDVAEQVNGPGRFDAVIHNAGSGLSGRQPRHHGRRSASALRHQHIGAMGAYGADPEAAAPRPSQLWPAPQR